MTVTVFPVLLVPPRQPPRKLSLPMTRGGVVVVVAAGFEAVPAFPMLPLPMTVVVLPVLSSPLTPAPPGLLLPMMVAVLKSFSLPKMPAAAKLLAPIAVAMLWSLLSPPTLGTPPARATLLSPSAAATLKSLWCRRSRRWPGRRGRTRCWRRCRHRRCRRSHVPGAAGGSGVAVLPTPKSPALAIPPLVAMAVLWSLFSPKKAAAKAFDPAPLAVAEFGVVEVAIVPDGQGQRWRRRRLRSWWRRRCLPVLSTPTQPAIAAAFPLARAVLSSLLSPAWPACARATKVGVEMATALLLSLSGPLVPALAMASVPTAMAVLPCSGRRSARRWKTRCRW